MAKNSTTLVEARHPGQKVNGVDGCHTRWGNDGWCDGVRKAEWLNSLGPDDAIYLDLGGRIVTNGKVRQNWLTEYEHLKVKEPASLYAEGFVNNYRFGLYQENEVYIDTSTYHNQLDNNAGKVYLTVSELEILLKLARGGDNS